MNIANEFDQRAKRNNISTPEDKPTEVVSQVDNEAKPVVPESGGEDRTPVNAISEPADNIKPTETTPEPPPVPNPYDTILKPKELSEEEQKKETKREKNRALIAALSDGLSSIANLYFTTKGAPSSFNKDTPTMSERNSRRYQEILDKREKAQREYQQLLLDAGKTEDVMQFQRDMQVFNQKNSSVEAEKNRRYQSGESAANREFQAQQDQGNKKFSAEESEKNRKQQTTLTNQRYRHDDTMFEKQQGRDFVKETIKASKTQSGDYVLLGADGVRQYTVPKSMKDSVIAVAYGKAKDIAKKRGAEADLQELAMAFSTNDSVAEMAARLSMLIGKPGYGELEQYYKKLISESGGSTSGGQISTKINPEAYNRAKSKGFSDDEISEYLKKY